MHYEFYFDAIQDKLTHAVAWRQAVAARHPADPRNLKAARELARLARSRFADVSPDTWTEIAPVLDSERLSDALNLAVREVGFRTNPADINAFIRTVGQAAVLTVEAA